jgi:hypothetical protein
VDLYSLHSTISRRGTKGVAPGLGEEEEEAQQLLSSVRRRLEWHTAWRCVAGKVAVVATAGG